jgi:enterochelin esterase-like enzyme
MSRGLGEENAPDCILIRIDPRATKITRGAFFHGLWCYPTGSTPDRPLPVFVRFDGPKIFFKILQILLAM